MSIPLSTRLPGDIKKAYADYEAKHKQYVKDIKAYNEAAKAWNEGSRTSPFTVPEPIPPTFAYSDEDIQAASRRDQQLRQSAVGVAFNPAAYNLSGFGFTPFGPNIATSMGRPKGATVTESGIGSLASGKIRLPDGTIFDPSQIKIDFDLTNFKMPFEGMTPQEVQDSLYILGQSNPFQ